MDILNHSSSETLLAHAMQCTSASILKYLIGMISIDAGYMDQDELMSFEQSCWFPSCRQQGTQYAHESHDRMGFVKHAGPLNVVVVGAEDPRSGQLRGVQLVRPPVVS